MKINPKLIIDWQSKAIGKYHKACIQNKPQQYCDLCGQAMDFALAIGTAILGEDYVPVN